MRETLGDRVLDEFCQLSEVHRDGWGGAWSRSGTLSSYLSTRPAFQDKSVFGALTSQSLDSAVVHERWASPGIAVVLDNQQPFVTGGLAFAHNGTIGNSQGNIVQRPVSYRESLSLVSSTTMSDSRIYADLFFLRLQELKERQQTPGTPPSPVEVREALALTIARLRQDYPEAGYNNVIETAEFTFATRAHADKPNHGPGLLRGYEAAGWSHRIESYYELAYTTIPHADGSVTSVATSSGYPASDPWTKLGNNRLLVLSHRDAAIQTLSLES